MAITRQLARLILLEHRYKPITGRVLLLGRQTVFMTPAEALALVEEMGVVRRNGARLEIDRATADSGAGEFISDRSFFGLFSDAEVLALDYSSYEGAEIVLDLCAGLPPELIGRFDFIYNGSVLDNIFDPAAAMRNISDLAAANGVIVHYEGAAHWAPAYLKFTPEWFFDYYAINAFRDCRCFLCSFVDIRRSPWDVHEWWPFQATESSLGLTRITPPESDCVVVAIAEKGPEATSHRMPTQGHYRREHSEYLSAFARFQRSGRTYGLASVGAAGYGFVGQLA